MFVVRQATPEDALGITIVNVYTWKTAYTGLVPDSLIDRRIADLLPIAEKTRLRIEQGSGDLIAAEENTVVGFCRYGACRQESGAGEGEIYALYTLAGYQRRGVGKALFAAASRVMKAQGYSGFIINCLSGNPALGFYRHLGGTVTGSWEDDASGYHLTGDELRFTL